MADDALTAQMQLARMTYRAYRRASGHRDTRGELLGEFDEMNTGERMSWLAAATAALAVCGVERPDLVQSPDEEHRRYRTGRTVGRTLYRRRADGTEELIGVLDTPALAAIAAQGMNAVDP